MKYFVNYKKQFPDFVRKYAKIRQRGASMISDKKWQILFFVTLLIWCFALAYPINPDYDLFARLIVGKSVIENGFILKHDFYSYAPTHLWLDHEWGASAIIYWVSTLSEFFNKSILTTLSAFKSLLVFGIFAIATICVNVRNSKYSPFNILYFALAVFASNIVFASTVRCHMFSFLLFTLFVLILELYRLHGKKWLLAILPFLMLLWGNIHGGCLSGLGLILIYAVGEFLNKKNPIPYLITLIVSSIVLFVNPYGFEYVKFLFTAGTMSREWISEWASPFATTFYAFKFKIYFIFMILIALLKGVENKFDLKNVDMTKLLLLVSTGYLAVMHTKLLPFFVILSAIFMFDDVLSILNKIRSLSLLANDKNKYVYAVILFISLSALNSANTSNNTISVNQKYLPYNAVEFLATNSVKGNILVDMTYGSYVGYKLYPNNKIFMDGRYEEVYFPDLLLEMKDFFRMNGNNFDKILTKYPTDIVLLQKNHTENLSKYLVQKNWREIFSDENFVVLIRPDYPKIAIKTATFDPKTIFDTEISAEMLKNFKE